GRELSIAGKRAQAWLRAKRVGFVGHAKRTQCRRVGSMDRRVKPGGDDLSPPSPGHLSRHCRAAPKAA
ncbi:MAG: hypothetical protein WAU59_04430, partial [Rhodoplanes sp.]